MKNKKIFDGNKTEVKTCNKNSLKHSKDINTNQSNVPKLNLKLKKRFEEQTYTYHVTKKQNKKKTNPRKKRSHTSRERMLTLKKTFIL